MSKEAYQPKGFELYEPSEDDLPYQSCTVWLPRACEMTVVDQYDNEVTEDFPAGDFVCRLKKITAAGDTVYLKHSNDEDAV